MKPKSEFRWQKLGRVLQPHEDLWWMQTHAMLPSPLVLNDGLVKVFFSGRDRDNISHIGWATIDLNGEDPRIVEISNEPVLSPGERGCFDDNGVTPSCVVRRDEKLYLYYIGWNPGFNVRMHLFGGLAISEDGGKSFTRYSRAPIIERSKVNPFLNTAPFVIEKDGGWIMYYVSGTEWIHKDLPRYNIQIAFSEDGCEWERQGDIAIDFKDETEMALARPWVIKNRDSTFSMWFGFKGDTSSGPNYRIGYAESADGITWERFDNSANIDVSEKGWDSEMLAYMSVFECNSRTYALYNGNNYGGSGIGLAVRVT